MLDTDHDRNPVEVLAEEFAQRCRQGECPSVADYAERYPQYADEIRDLFPSVGMMEQLRRKEHSDREQLERQTRFKGKRFERLGEYEIVREIGRGGMGVVFEARQKSLGRRVALKVLASGMLSSPKQLLRFQREATAAARLHHTNIVPVFGVGEHDDVHYYVMQYIDGVGLNEVLTELRRLSTDPCQTTDPGHDRTDASGEQASTYSASLAARALCDGTSRMTTASETETSVRVNAVVPFRRGDRYWKAVGRIGLQVAEALAYAHAQGVLHRDIKPANLLVDTQGTAWIADFGLAKLQEAEDLTKSGDIVGTLRYMAPEQFTGQVDERTDIYSLGLTLYELLTLTPACEDTAQLPLDTSYPARTLARPRSVDPAIPRDLETIVLKATAADPARRYASAAAMVDDLQRFLDDRPILARRASTVERLWRWSRRNPLVASLAATSLALVITVAVVMIVSNIETHRALVRVEEERNRAQAEHGRAEANLDLAMQAFTNIIESVASRGVPRSAELDLEDVESPKFEAVVTAADAELLQSLLKFFDEFARSNRADLQAETAQAHRRVGDIRQRLGQLDLAEAAYHEALTISRTLAEKHPQDPKYVVAQAEILNSLGIVQSRSGQMSPAIASHVAAKELLDKQPPEITQTRAARFELAQTLNLIASVGPRSGMFGGPGPDHHHHHRGHDGHHAPRPGPPRTGDDRPRPPPREPGPDNRGPNPFAMMKENHQRAVELLNGLAQEEPANAEYQLALATSHRNHLLVAWMSDRSGAAESLEEAIRILDRLVVDRPKNPRFRFELADTLATTGPMFSSTMSDERVRERLERAVAISQELTDSFPGIPEYRALLASSRTKLAGIERAAGELANAGGQYRQAIDLQTSLVEQFPAVPVYRFALARWLGEWGRIERDRGEAAESRQALEAGIKSVEAALEKSGHKHPFDDRMLGGLYASWSETLRQSGATEEADAAARKARELGAHGHGPGHDSHRRNPSNSE